jgi:RNA polymerase sigma-70 factor (ECF subfamily)
LSGALDVAARDGGALRCKTGSSVVLLESLGAHLPGGARLPDDQSRLEAVLNRLVAEASDAWPTLTVTPEEFVAYLAARLPPGEEVLGGLEQLEASDLFLACACTRGDPAALALFDRQFIAPLASYLNRAEALPAFTDEVKQAVRVRLLVSEDGVLPRIASYRGRAPLALWLRLAAARLAINLRKSERGDRADEDEVARLRSAGPDPEIEFFKTHYREELRNATERALAGLPDRDSNLLRLHFFERLSAEAIGAMHDVSARTVQRWLAEIREHIVAETRRLLNERWKMTENQFESVLGLVGSQMEISVRRLLGKPPG